MLKKNLQFSVSYLFIFILQIIVESDPNAAKFVLAEFHYIIKPAITISLMVYLAFRTQLNGRFSKRIFAGLFFCLVGDCYLMFDHINPNFFIFGLSSFLIGHLFYISAFYLDYKWHPKIERKSTWTALIVYSAFCIGFFLFLNPYLSNLKIPVFIYAIVISMMAFMAVNRKGRVNTGSYNLIFYGSIFFVISDSILAYHKFVAPVKFAGVAIMGTYMLAQYFITIGAVERKLRKHAVIDTVQKA